MTFWKLHFNNSQSNAWRCRNEIEEKDEKNLSME